MPFSALAEEAEREDSARRAGRFARAPTRSEAFDCAAKASIEPPDRARTRAAAAPPAESCAARRGHSADLADRFRHSAGAAARPVAYG
ncbi:hypothetical protein, partial [Methylobacterium sp. WL120]|uniref:hypothetical protein n=1 Tax=Methylobacterium sp. WL120 TaxID=2603887 RepID=UPI001AEE9A2E